MKKKEEVKKEVALENPDKPINFDNQVDVAKYLLSRIKEDYANYQQKVVVAKAQEQTARNNISGLRADFDQKMAAEKGKFENERTLKWNALIQQDEKLNRLQTDMNRRNIILKEQELANKAVADERREMVVKRVELENIINENKSTLAKGNTLIAQAQDKMNTASAMLNDAKNQIAEAKAAEVRDQNILNLINQKKDQIAKEQENLEQLRANVTPQIEELKTRQADLDKTMLELTRKENNINAKIAEERRLISELDSKAKLNSAKDLELATREEASLRRETSDKNKGKK